MTVFWSCAQTHPHQEKLALINLRRQNFTSFFPYFLIKNKKGVLTPRAAFPGYVFIRLTDLTHWAPINFTLGIRRLLTSTTDSDYRSPCRADFIDELRRMRIMGDLDTDIIPAGTMVKIKNGPFSNQVAFVEMSNQLRIRVLLKVFNREMSLEFSTNSVERVVPAAD